MTRDGIPSPGTPNPNPRTPYRKPALPKADFVVESIFERNDTKVTLMAIAKVTEDTISCWTPKGEPAPEMKERLEEYFGADAVSPIGSQTLGRIIYGKKNRIAILSIVQSLGSRSQIHIIGTAGEGVYPGIVSLDSGLYRGNGSHQTAGVSSQSAPTRLYALPITAEPSESAAPLQIRAIEPVLNPPIFEAKVGASVKSKGIEYTVRSIGAATKTAGNSYGEEFRWQVIFGVNGSSRGGTYLNLLPLNAAGNAIGRVNAEGEPITNEEFDRLMEEFEREMRSANGKRTGPQFPRFDQARTQQEYSGNRNQDEVKILLNVNPKAVARFKVSETNQLVIEFKDVPLDPR